MNEYYVFSSGGGRQSSAALVLSAHGIFPYKTHIFCDVGEDSENPETIAWVHDVLIPYAKLHDINFIVARTTKKTLYRYINETRYSIPIPAKLHYKNGKKAIGMRACTNDYKIRVADKTIKDMFGDKKNPPLVHVALGISVDEIQRAKKLPPTRYGAGGKIDADNKNHYWTKTLEYPFIFNTPFSLFGRDFGETITVEECSWIVEHENLGSPPKSACWFCPYHSIKYWKDLYNSENKLDRDMYKKAVQLENLLQIKAIRMAEKHANENKQFNGFDVYLSDLGDNLFSIPLKDVVDGVDENCESGYCMV